jgi:hypothetical protein
LALRNTEPSTLKQSEKPRGIAYSDFDRHTTETTSAQEDVTVGGKM